MDDTRDTQYSATEPRRGLDPGGSIGGTIEDTSDVDVFDITLQAGRTYTFTISGSMMPNRGLRLYDDDGTWITGNSSTNQFTYTVTENGPFYLYAYGSGATGAYTVSADAGFVDDTRDTYLDATLEARRGFAPGNSIGGSIEIASDVDVFDIALEKGRTYTFTISGSTMPNRGLRLYDDDGTWIAGNSSTNQFTYTVTENGPFHLYAYGSGATGNYTVSADAGFVDDTRDTYLDVTLEAQRGFAPGGSIGGTIEIAGDVDVFDITLEQGRTYTFTISGSTMPNRGLRLYDDDGTWIAGNTSTNQFTYQATSGGPFHLYAYGSGATGAYTVSETSSFVDDTRDTYLDTLETRRGFAPGGSIGGSIEIAGDVDVFDITLQAGRVYTFTISGSMLPNRGLRLYDDDGTWIAGNTSTNQFTYTATENGPFYLYAYGSGGTGAYTVSASGGSAAPLPVVRIDAVSANKLEGSTGGTTEFTFKVTRSGDLSSASSVDWGLNFGIGSPADASDFTGTSGRVSFAAGEIEQLVTVRVNADTLIEGNENFLVELRNPAGATINANANVAAGTIQNDDGSTAPVLAIMAASADKLEGSSGGLTEFTFTVTRGGDTSGASSVNWQVGATATNSVDGSDFANGHPLNGTVTFTAGQTQQTVTVRIAADTLVESDETFVVRLSNPTNGSIQAGGEVATGIVRNDDGTPARPDLDVTTLTLSSGTITSGGSVTFNYHLENVGTAMAGASKVGFYASTDGVFDANDTLLFEQDVAGLAAGASIDGSQTRSITGNGTYTIFAVADSGKVVTEISEANNPSDGRSLTISPPAAPVVGIVTTSANRLEGSNGGVTPYTFTVTRSGDTSSASTVDWQVFATGTSPAGSADFSGLSGQVSFAAGETSKLITVRVNADTTVEANETFGVRLRNPVNATIDAAKTSATGIIRNDDSAPSVVGIVATSADHAEGSDGGTTPFTFTVTREGGTTGTSTVAWALYSTSPGATIDTGDYADPANGIVTFASGQTSQTITINVRADTAIEADESFAVQLDSATGATINPNKTFAVGTIRNDDAPPAPVVGIVTTSANRLEGSNGGVTPYTFTVTRSGDTSSASTVDWQVFATGTSPAGSADFSGLSGQVSFAAGETSKLITVKVNADTTVEANETFGVRLRNPVNATIDAAKTSATGIIRNDDVAPRPDLDVTTLTLSRNTLTTGGVATLSYHLENIGTADAAASTVGFYRSTDSVFDASDVLVFQQNVGALAAGAAIDGRLDVRLSTVGSYQFIAVADSGKVVTELSETNNPSNAAPVTVAPLPVLSIAAASADKNEGSNGALTPYTFTVTRTGSTTDASTVTWQLYQTTGATIDAQDYDVPTSGQLIFAAGQTTKAITIRVRADTTIEQDEGLAVKLETATGATIDASKQTAFGVIRNDDTLNTAAHDLNGDGKSDILWRNDSGAALLWQMNGETITTETALGTEPVSKQLVDAADFTGDGRADLLWHVADGSVFIWEMNGGQAGTKTTLAGPGAGWAVQDAADFGGDGKSDILWRHSDGRVELWQMNGAQAATKTALGASSTADAIADAADFNGDGRADILWQNGNGSAAIWLMNGASTVSKTTVAGPGAGWTIQDAADFGGDGKSDILWRHSDGRVELWQMNGTTVASRASLGDVDTALTIVDAADFNGDKRADILWRNTDGEVTMWEMNGAQILDASDVRTMAAAWKVVNHDLG